MGLLGTAGARSLTEAAATNPLQDTDEPAAKPLQDVPFQVLISQREFLPEILAVPKGATVTFVGNRLPHTVTSTDSLVDVVNGCGEGGTGPYDGEEDQTYVTDGADGEKGEDGIIRYTIEDAEEPYSVFIESGGTTEITYDAVGQFPYYCVPHCGSQMMGMVVVEGQEE